MKGKSRVQRERGPNALRRRTSQSLGFAGAVLASLMLSGTLGAVSAALREPPQLSRDEVRSGLQTRQRAMEVRQELRRLRQLEGRRNLGGGRGGAGGARLPRDPIPAPPPASLP